jgi:hypothetical protein
MVSTIKMLKYLVFFACVMIIFNLHRSDKSGAEKLTVKIRILWLSANYFEHFHG